MADVLRSALLIAQKQHGLITRTQAIDAGVHPSSVDRWVRDKHWSRAAPGVFRVNGSTVAWEQRALALCLSAGPDAVVSHRAAAYLYGLEGFGPPGRIELAVPRHLRHRRLGALVHETKDWDRIDVRMRHGIPVTGPARTLLDICWVCDDDLVALACFDELRRLRHVDWPELWECLVVHGRRGRNGTRRFRRTLLRRWGKKSPRGYFARAAMALLEDAGLPEPSPEHHVRVDGHDYFIDLAYAALLIAIELDDDSHNTEKAQEEDPIRQKRIESLGWLFIRITWEELTEHPERVVRRIREAIAARSGAR